MRITRIVVKDLFGLFDHDIALRTSDRITIIHSPNGYGKTALLTMINAVFGGSYEYLRRTPFREFSIHFDDKSILRVTKERTSTAHEGKRSQNGGSLVFRLKRPRGKELAYPISERSHENVHFPLEMIEAAIPDLDRVGPDTWRVIPTNELLSFDDVLYRYEERLPFGHFPSRRRRDVQWLRDIRKAIDVRLIETQRLLRFPSTPSPREYRARPMRGPAPSVASYSEDLAKAIQQKLAEYAAMSQSLDRTFPTRLVKAKSTSSFSDLSKSLRDLEEKRSRLITAGFLEKGAEADFSDLQKIDESNRNVLSVYVQDVTKKLAVFDELTNKIDLLVTVINTRFLYKQMSIGKKEGFVFTTSDGKPLQPASLSSGEQHELVLLYQLLFEVSANSLVLIDEPELSLHVVWQQQFLKDLLQITDLAGFHVLTATHSPQIIHDRWDLAVELKGRE